MNEIRGKCQLAEILKFLLPGAFFFFALNAFFQSFGFSKSALVLLFATSVFSALWITRYQFLPLLPATLLPAGCVVFLLTMEPSLVSKYFISFCSLLFVIMLIGLYRFFGLQEKDKKRKVKLLDSGFGLNQAVIMFSIFLIFAGIYGIYIIAGIHTWQMMVIIFFCVYIASFYLTKTNFIKSRELGLHLDYYKNRTFKFYPLLASFILLELVWTMTFLPINHLTFGAIILAAYYSYWSMIKSYLRNELTHRKFLKYVCFASIASAIIFLSGNFYL